MSLLTRTIKDYHADAARRNAARRREPAMSEGAYGLLFMGNIQQQPSGTPWRVPKREGAEGIGGEFVVPRGGKLGCKWFMTLAVRIAHLDAYVIFDFDARSAIVTDRDGTIYIFDANGHAAVGALGDGIDHRNLREGERGKFRIEGSEAEDALPIVRKLLEEGRPPDDPLEFRKILKKYAILRRIPDPAERREAALGMLEEEQDWRTAQSRAARWLKG